MMAMMGGGIDISLRRVLESESAILKGANDLTFRFGRDQNVV